MGVVEVPQTSRTPPRCPFPLPATNRAPRTNWARAAKPLWSCAEVSCRSRIAGSTGTFGHRVSTRPRRSSGSHSTIGVSFDRPMTAHWLGGLTVPGQFCGSLALVASPPLTVNVVDLLTLSPQTLFPWAFWKVAPTEPSALVVLMETAAEI